MNGQTIARGYINNVRTGQVTPFALYSPAEFNNFEAPFVLYQSFVNPHTTVLIAISEFLENLQKEAWRAVATEVVKSAWRIAARDTSFDVATEIWHEISLETFESGLDFDGVPVGSMTCNSDKTILTIQSGSNKTVSILTSNELYEQLYTQAETEADSNALLDQYDIYLRNARFCFVDNLNKLTYGGWYESLNG